MEAKKRAVPIVSSMGTANKLDPTKFEVADIYETSVCPLARVMRRELKARGVQGLKVVYSKELPKKTHLLAVEQSDKEAIASSLKPSASISFVPSVAGLILAGVALQDLGGFGG